MNHNVQEELKERVHEFIMQQDGYNESEHNKIRVFIDDKGCVIIVGEDEVVGISGEGNTPELFYDDFTQNWNRVNGFAWLKRNE